MTIALKQRLVIAATLILAAVLTAALWPRDEGPLYEGKTVAWWIEHRQMSDIVSFPDFDSNAVPYLVKGLDAKDGKFKSAYIGLREKSPTWIRNITPERIPAYAVRQNALIAIRHMGPTAKPAIPALVRVATENDDVVAVFAIGNMGTRDEDVQKALSQLAGSTNATVAKYAKNLLQRNDFQMPIPRTGRTP